MNVDARDPADPAATETQIELLVDGLRDILGPDLVGAYPHGSAVLGGFRPDSDVDVIVVARRWTTGAEKRRLIDLLLSISGRRCRCDPAGRSSSTSSWSRRSGRGDTRPRLTSTTTSCCGIGSRAGSWSPWDGTTNKGLASALTMVLLGGTSLAEYLPRDTRNVVLTLARIWSAVATEAVYSKDDAAGWALSRLPEEHRAVLELAHAAYRGEAEDSWDELGPQVRAYADHLVSEIERARAETDRAT